MYSKNIGTVWHRKFPEMNSTFITCPLLFGIRHSFDFHSCGMLFVEVYLYMDGFIIHIIYRFGKKER